MALDVTQPAQVRKAIESILARWKEVDVLVNNAAAVIDEAVWRMTETAWDQVIAAGLKGAFLCSRAVAQAMATQGCGHIINISSAAGRKGGRGRSNYAAAKAGLLGLTVSLARELAPSNILVNAVLPGVLPTAMTRRLSPPQQEELVSANVLCRMNAIDEVAAFVVHLAGMRNVSGQVFQLDSRVVSWI
jgi:3-oxoacyl-[acyl-carrier protein] reductase